MRVVEALRAGASEDHPPGFDGGANLFPPLAGSRASGRRADTVRIGLAVRRLLPQADPDRFLFQVHVEGVGTEFAAEATLAVAAER